MDDVSRPAGRSGLLYTAITAHADRMPWPYAVQLISRGSFREALLCYCTAMIEPSAMKWPANKFFGQKLRYLVSFALIGLDARWRRGEGDAPTLAALQRTASASARQIAGLVNAMKLGGYIVAGPLPEDRRAIRLSPSMQLLQEVGRSPLAFLEASERLDPPPSSLAERLGGDDLGMANWLGGSYDLFVQGDVYFSPFSNIVEFTGQDCGYPVLSAVLAGYYAGLAGIAAPVLLSYGVLADRFRVSRQHIGNILGSAERRGCFAVDRGGRRVTVSADFLWEFESWAAGQMALYRRLAEGAKDPTQQSTSHAG